MQGEKSWYLEISTRFKYLSLFQPERTTSTSTPVDKIPQEYIFVSLGAATALLFVIGVIIIRCNMW